MIVKSKAPLVLVIALSTIIYALPADAQERFDIILTGGRVMDPETGLDAIRNVGIRGQTIVAISEDPLDGEVEVDVSGLVVAPGFIDPHAHGQSNRANEFQARDGVTTALELEGGVIDVERGRNSPRRRQNHERGSSRIHDTVGGSATPSIERDTNTSAC